MVKKSGIESNNSFVVNHQGGRLVAVVVLSHLSTGLRIGADVALFKSDLPSLQIDAHQLAGETAGLDVENNVRHGFNQPVEMRSQVLLFRVEASLAKSSAEGRIPRDAGNDKLLKFQS